LVLDSDSKTALRINTSINNHFAFRNRFKLHSARPRYYNDVMSTAKFITQNYSFKLHVCVKLLPKSQTQSIRTTKSTCKIVG